MAATSAAAGTGTLRGAGREQLALVCALVAGAQVTWGAIVPALPLYRDLLGISAFALGGLVAAFGVGRLLVNLPAGLLADRFGPRRLLLGALAGLVLVTVATATVTTFPVLLAMRGLAGVLGGTVVTVGLALVTSRAPAGARGSALAAAQAAQLIGAALGPVVGGVVLDLWGLPAVFLASCVPAALCLLWAVARPDPAYWARHLPEPAAAVVGGAGDAGARVGQAPAARRVPMTSDLAAFVGLNVVGFAVFVIRFGGEQSLVPILGYAAGLTPTTLGLALGAVTVVSLALLPLTARLLDRGWRMRLLVPGMLLAAGAMLLYPAATTPWTFAVLLVVAGLTAGTAGLVPAVVLADVVHPGRHGRAVGILRTTGDLGAVLGPLTLGLVLDGAGAIWACATLATVAAGSALVHLGLTRPSRRRLRGGDGVVLGGTSGRLVARSTRRTSQDSST